MADLSSFESCSASVSALRSSSNWSRTWPSTTARRVFSRIASSEAADLDLAQDVLLARVHAELRCELARQLLDDRSGLAQALGLDPLADPAAVLRLELGGELGVEVLRLAGACAELFLRVADLHDLAVRELEGLEDLVLGDLVGAGLDHRQRVLRADDDQVERALLLDDRQGRVDDEIAVDPSDPDGAHRAQEGQRRDHQRRGGAVDAEDVVRGDEVGRQRRADHVHLVLVALRPERPDRAVDHAGGEDGPFGGPSLALEETAGDLPGGVHALFDVDRQREEVGAFAALHLPLRGREDHRLAGADDDGAVRLLGELARLERHLLLAHGHRDRGEGFGHRAHLCLHFLVESRGLSQLFVYAGTG